jgi:hypothetical protein
MTADAVTALLAAPDLGTRLRLRDQFFMILMYDLAARDAGMLALTLATSTPGGSCRGPAREALQTQALAHHQRDGPALRPLRRRFHPSPEPAAPRFYTVRNHCPTRMYGDELADVALAELEALVGDHDPAAGADLALDPDRSGGQRRGRDLAGRDGGAADVGQAVDADGAWPGACQDAVGDGVHEVPVQAQGNGPAGQLVAGLL